MTARRRGFTLIEVMAAVVIVAIALLGLQATVSGAIKDVGDSINRRAARECCRAKLEEVLAGVTPPDGGGGFDERPGFTWTSTRTELNVGVPEHQSEVVELVTVVVTFPIDSAAGAPAGLDASGAEPGTDTIKLASVLPKREEEPR